MFYFEAMRQFGLPGLSLSPNTVITLWPTARTAGSILPAQRHSAGSQLLLLGSTLRPHSQTPQAEYLVPFSPQEGPDACSLRMPAAIPIPKRNTTTQQSARNGVCIPWVKAAKVLTTASL